MSVSKRYLVAAVLLVAWGCTGESPEPVASAVAEPAVTFQLVEVATSERLWTGVAVAPDGRVFVNYPRWSPAVTFSVGELKDGEVVPYPDPETNRWDDSLTPADHFICVQSVYVDGDGFLWILDPANALFAGVVEGGAKLLKVDLASDEIVRTILFDHQVAPPASYLNDVRVDTERQVAYITDSSTGALVVVDLATGTSRQVLADHPSTKAEDVVLTIGGVEMVNPDGSKPQIHSDGLALSGDREYLYYQALTGRTLYRIPTRDLRDATLDAAALGEKVETVAESGASDAIAFAPDGHLYLTSLEFNAIRRLTPGGAVEVVVEDQRISWPDSFAITPDGTVYFTTSQLHLGPQPPEPYRIFKIAAVRE